MKEEICKLAVHSNMKNLKTCLVILCLLSFRMVGMPQFCGANSFMKEIQLTHGYVALVDDSDYVHLNQWKWWAKIYKNGNVYATRTKWLPGTGGKSKSFLMHRQILQVTDSSILIDHKDRNGLNNQRSNLRICTRSQNNSNRASRPNCTSKYLGVSFSKTSRKWIANISKNNKSIVIGHFDCEHEAARAYNKKALELRGEFASLNKIEE